MVRLALGDSGPILFDFDGPICGVFAGHPAPLIARDLLSLIEDSGETIPISLRDESDPMEILRWSDTLGTTGLVERVDVALRAAEMIAIRTATPTPFAQEIILSARKHGRPVAVVSNNAAEAVTAYLDDHGLSSYISPVVGRAYAEPALMKPSPGPVLDALAQLAAAPEEAVLIGDSLSDIQASRAAGVRVIAYANKSRKITPFRDAGADVVVTTLADVAAILSLRWPAPEGPA